MKHMLLALTLLAPIIAHATDDVEIRKLPPSAYEVSILTVKGAKALKIFQVLEKAGFPTSTRQGISLLETSAINCRYHDPERDGHWVTENCQGGESAALSEDIAKQIAPKIVKVASFPNEKQVLATLPGGYETADMGRGIFSWEKVKCEVPMRENFSNASCEVIYRSDY